MFVLSTGRVKRVMFYMTLSFIMYALVETGAVISSLILTFWDI